VQWGAVALSAALCAQAMPAAGQGIALRGVGPVNESMGGAAVACPIDSAGAIHWNPASISGLPCSDMSFGFGMLLPTESVSSRIGAGALGPGSPPVDLSGSDGSEPGICMIPTMALVRKIEGSPWSFGLGVFGVGGSHVSYPASTTNPILFPQPLGLGRLSASVDVLQIDPTISYELTDHLSVGVAPTITLANLIASPLMLGPKFADNQWAEGIGTRYTWGGGFQVGAYYKTDTHWSLGASLKSPQWMEPFRFRTQDSFGLPQEVTFRLDYPMIVSVGAAYTGFEKWTIATDIRYFNYAGTSGFGGGGFAANGALTGLDWRDVYSVALGVQRQIGQRFSLRMGYCYNDNPITSEASAFNVASPLITQHSLHLGGSYVFSDNWLLSVAYVHAFENTVSGPIESAGVPPLANTSVASNVSADELLLGFTKRF
jgi:long-chain fatty acid transport protein